MIKLFARPIVHRLVARHDRQTLLMENKTRRAVGEPADIFEHFPDQAALRGHQSLVRVRTGWRDEREEYAFRRFWTQVSEIGIFKQISDEKADGFWKIPRVWGCRRRDRGPRRFGMQEPESTKALAALRHRAVAAQVRSGSFSDPAEWFGIDTQSFQRPSNG